MLDFNYIQMLFILLLALSLLSYEMMFFLPKSIIGDERYRTLSEEGIYPTLQFNASTFIVTIIVFLLFGYGIFNGVSSDEQLITGYYELTIFFLLYNLSVIDWNTRLLPNILTYNLIALAIFMAISLDSLIENIFGGCLAVIIVYLAKISLSLTRGKYKKEFLFGMGDTKLIFGLIMLLGYQSIGLFFIFTSIFGILSFLVIKGFSLVRGQDVDSATLKVPLGPSLVASYYLCKFFY